MTMPTIRRPLRALCLTLLTLAAVAAFSGGGAQVGELGNTPTTTLPTQAATAGAVAAGARAGLTAVGETDAVAQADSGTGTGTDGGSDTLSTWLGVATIATTSTTAATTTATTAAATPGAVPAAATAPAANAELQAPALPRTGLVPADLAVLYAAGDATSEAIARAYQRARGIPEANLVRVSLPAGNDTRSDARSDSRSDARSDAISDSDFATIKATLDARLPAHIQATLVTWTQPSRVVGASCAMGLTSALAFGYNPVLCGGCNRTQVSAYYDTDTTRPWTDLRIRPSMMLGAATLDAAQALITRGLAADGSAPTGTGWGVRTTDTARSVRYPDYLNLPGAWSAAPGPTLRFLDASAAGSAQELTQQTDLLFYFTGLARVPLAASNRFLPGAVADHLTSYGGYLPGAKGQMPATDWLTAGATASYGTVEEPCNHTEKFPRASVLVDHYVRGATVIEAYWKSVAMPGQGLFIGEPLARPWAHVPTARIEAGDLVVRSRGLRRNANYRVEWQDAGSSLWRSLADTIGGQPQLLTWRVPLPVVTTGGRLRWVGPCPLQPSLSCVLAS